MKRTLLVIDDNRSVRETLKLAFTRRGYIVFTAENGAHAWEVAEREQIDGAFIDIHMPGLNGIVLCRGMIEQAKAKGRPLAVWLITGAKTQEVATLAQGSGALALLTKPFDFGDLDRRLKAQFPDAGEGESGPQPSPTSP